GLAGRAGARVEVPVTAVDGGDGVAADAERAGAAAARSEERRVGREGEVAAVDLELDRPGGRARAGAVGADRGAEADALAGDRGAVAVGDGGRCVVLVDGLAGRAGARVEVPVTAVDGGDGVAADAERAGAAAAGDAAAQGHRAAEVAAVDLELDRRGGRARAGAVGADRGAEADALARDGRAVDRG